MQLYHQLLF